MNMRSFVRLNSRALLVAGLLLGLVSTSPLPAAEKAGPDTLCFLSGIELDARDSTLRGVELEMICAHAEQRVVALDEEATDLRLLDEERDLFEAGRSWLEERKESGGSVGFSSQPWNTFFVSDDRERHLELTAHSHALPESGTVRFVGSAGLIVEADCVGSDAQEPVPVTVTAADLRSGAEIPFEHGAGGNLKAAEHGSSGDAPMLALTGGGTFISLVDPPEGVRTLQFFGKERLVVEPEVADETEITIDVCPTRLVVVPVDIEARAVVPAER